MKSTLGLIGLVLGVLLLIVLGGGLFVLVAYGVGWVLTRFLPFSPFEATLLSLVSLSVAGLMAWRLVTAFISSPTVLDEEDLADLDFEDEAWEELDEDEEESDEPTYPGVPRWRQPLKKLDFSNVKPDDLCPCGSGRKYKNCHGRKTR
jgi:hypothetical protein